MLRRSNRLVVGLALALAVVGCKFDTSNFATNGGDDAAVEDPSGDAALPASDAPGSDAVPGIDGGAGLDAALADASDCDPVCASCDNGICVVDCTAPGSCPDEVTCPSGLACSVTCGVGACGSGVDCSASESCDIVCSGNDSCGGELTCGIGRCDVECSGNNSCDNGTTCDEACACSVSCSGAGSCNSSSLCPSGCGVVPTGGCTDIPSIFCDLC